MSVDYEWSRDERGLYRIVSRIRDVTIFNMVKCGLPYSTIGPVFGISANRARVLFKRAAELHGKGL